MIDLCSAVLADFKDLVAPVPTTLRGKGKAVELRPESGEVVLAHVTDSPLARKKFGHPESAGKILDGLFYWRRTDAVHVVLVELKGNHVTDACKQLEVGHQLVKRRLPAKCAPIQWHGFVAPSSASQQQSKAAVADFHAAHGFRPVVKSLPAGSKCLSIREFFV